MNGQRWLRSKCSNSLNRSLLPRSVGTCDCKSLRFASMACSLLGSVVIALMMFSHCSVTSTVCEYSALLFLLEKIVLSSVSTSAYCCVGGRQCVVQVAPATMSGEYTAVVSDATVGGLEDLRPSL